MPHKKINLPSKICLICDKPFAWRKKWHDCWDEVKYCSQRCRRHKSSNENPEKMKSNKHA